MKVLKISLVSVLCGLAWSAGAQTVPSVSTQEPAQIRNPRVTPPASPKVSTAQEEANKRIVMQWHYEFFDLGNFEEASNKYMAPDFMQNDPKEPSGRAQYVANFKSNGYKPGAVAKRPPILAVFAEGDLVMTVIPEQWPKPAGVAAETGTIHCNMYRLKDGRITAMWVSGGAATAAPAKP